VCGESEDGDELVAMERFVETACHVGERTEQTRPVRRSVFDHERDGALHLTAAGDGQRQDGPSAEAVGQWGDDDPAEWPYDNPIASESPILPTPYGRRGAPFGHSISRARHLPR
jgi:hypothetical protein